MLLVMVCDGLRRWCPLVVWGAWGEGGKKGGTGHQRQKDDNMDTVVEKFHLFRTINNKNEEHIQVAKYI